MSAFEEDRELYDNPFERPADPVPDDRFQMLYCDSATCRVNTFERGDGSQYIIPRKSGLCPGCGQPGEVVR